MSFLEDLAQITHKSRHMGMMQRLEKGNIITSGEIVFLPFVIWHEIGPIPKKKQRTKGSMLSRLAFGLKHARLFKLSTILADFL